MSPRSLPKGIRRAVVAMLVLMVIGGIGVVVFADAIVNSLVKPRLVSAFTAAYPQYDLQAGHITVGILSGRVACDSIAVRERDTMWSARSEDCAVSGIHWWEVLLNGSVAPEDLASAVLEMKEGMLHLAGPGYELHCASLRVSAADSSIVMTSVSWSPTLEDEEMFASHPYRQTRARVTLPRIDIAGAACLDLFQGTRCRIRSIRLEDPVFDILLNKDKPAIKDTIPPMMPVALLASIGIPLRIDSLSMIRSELHYGERYGVGTPPGMITFDSVQVVVEGVTNNAATGDTVRVQVNGRFMRAGAMRVRMMIPLDQQDLSYQFAGSLSGMRLAPLNAFLEHAEQTRITEGVLQDAAFAIVVAAGHARGSVHAFYRDLTVAKIDRRTGSAEGILDRIASMIGNRVTIKRTNMPGHAGTKIGAVRYDHRVNEAFIEFSWFALRSGVGNVVGF